MPVINIKTLPVREVINVPEILISLNKGVSEALGCSINNVWSYWQFIESGYYAAGSKIAERVHEETHSPLVNVILMEGTDPAKLKAMFDSIALILSDELETEYSNIFITIDEKKP